MRNAVTEAAAASPADAIEHFSSIFSYETDCWDVRQALSSGNPGFILLDVRSQERFAAGHVPGAFSLPLGMLTEARLADYKAGTLFVVYCEGPHCNGAARAALRLAQFHRRVKLMAGGIAGWLDEGFELVDDTPSEM